MGQVIRLWIAGFMIQLFGFVSFLGIAQTVVGEPEKQATIILFCISTFILLAIAVYKLVLKMLMLLAALLALSFTCTYHLLGFTLFGGLVKDIKLFSPNHLIGLAEGMSLLFGAYALGMLGIWAIGKLLQTFISEHAISSFWSRFRELWDIW